MGEHFKIFGPGESYSGMNPARPRPASNPTVAGLSHLDVHELRQRAEYAERRMRDLQAESLAMAQVAEIRDDRMLLVMGPGAMLDVNLLEGAQVGDRVRCHRQTMQAIDIIRDAVPPGSIVSVQRQSGGVIEAEVMSMLKTFKVPALRPGDRGYDDGLASHSDDSVVGSDHSQRFKQFKKGERVVVDATNQFVIGSLGMPPPAYAHVPAFQVEWDDIGGQEHAKMALREAIELPTLHPELFRAYGKRPTRGVLLAGPPGCGKSVLAKAAATALARAHGQDVVKGWFYTKGPEVLSSFIGRTEEAIRGVFAAGRRHYKEHGYPAVWFLDECDALLTTRTRGEHVSFNQTVVPQFLAEMDGLDENSMMLILATNRPDVLDPAVTRDGRVDRKIEIPRPTIEDARKIFEIHLRDKPLSGDPEISIEQVAEVAAEDLYSRERIVRLPGTDITVDLGSLASGAMIEGCVDLATSSAIQREIAKRNGGSGGGRASRSDGSAAGSGHSKIDGIQLHDLKIAIDRQQDNLRHMSVEDALRELAKRGMLPGQAVRP